MNHFKLLLFASFLFAAIVSCNKKDEPNNIVAVESITVSPDQLTIVLGQTHQLSVTIIPDNATDKTIVWTSSEKSVATVSNTGLVQALAEGTATIRAIGMDGKVSGECTVTVLAAEIISGSRQDVILQEDFGGSGSAGDDVSGGSGASQGNEDSNKNGINYVYGKNTVAVTDAVMEKVSNITIDGFKLPADSHGRSSIGYGDVLVFPKCELFPGGYAAKVTNISKEGDGFYYSTTLAAIDEIFDTLHLEQTALDLTPYIEKIVREDGTEVEWTKTKAGVSISIPEIFGGINGLAFDLGDNVEISPSAEINLNLDVDADVVGNKLTYAKLQVNTSSSLSADVSIKKGAEKKWVSKRVKVIVAAIPVGPVIITPEVYATFELRLSDEINMTFSFNYQKAYYAYSCYNGNGIYGDGGELVTNKKDPFTVTGNISGGIELGPNIGAGVSIYGGALGVGVYCGPHATCSFTGSFPFTAETLANLDRPGMWLSNAYYEPSALLRYGGSVEVAYLWHKDYEAPVTFSYSFGRTFIIPTLGKKLDIQTSKGGKASISTTIRNKAMFCDNIYVKIRQGGPEGPVLFNCPFTIPRKPEAEDDEVGITASVNNLDLYKLYYVDGPYISFSILGYTREVEMEPVQDVDKYIDLRAVDLGLSVKWASCNVGATAPEDYGDYFAWGEIEPYYESLKPLVWRYRKEAGYDWSSYQWCNGTRSSLTKYNTSMEYGSAVDNKLSLVLADDAAHVNWLGNWRMPKHEEWTELCNNCTSVWTTQNSVNGILFTSNINGNSIFLPAAGYLDNNFLYGANNFGRYWSSTLYSIYHPDTAWNLCISPDSPSMNDYDRDTGLLVRPVSE